MADCNFCDEVKKWYRQPLRTDGSAMNWFLFVGLILVIIFAWTRILERIV